MSFKKLTDVYFTLNTGAKIPALGFGTYNTPDNYDAVEEAVYVAIKEAGYRQIDCAFNYKTEPSVGRALKRLFDEGVVKREELFITTKVWATHYDAVEESFQKSLSDLGLGYVDLLLQHWPLCYIVDSEHKLILGQDGKPQINENYDYRTFYQNLEKLTMANPDKIKALGVSNYSIPYLTDLLKVAKIVPVVNQYECHPELPQLDLFNFCQSHNILVTLYSPLGATGAPLLANEHVQKLHEKYPEYTLNEILYSYHVQSHRIVIPRSINHKRIVENVKLVPLTKEDIAELEKSKVKRYMSNKYLKLIGFE